MQNSFVQPCISLISRSQYYERIKRHHIPSVPAKSTATHNTSSSHKACVQKLDPYGTKYFEGAINTLSLYKLAYFMSKTYSIIPRGFSTVSRGTYEIKHDTFVMDHC